jgi:hypothetical protein
LLKSSFIANRILFYYSIRISKPILFISSADLTFIFLSMACYRLMMA